MRIGIDFDNTIVCYDGLFHKVALEQGLIPPGLPASKSEVRNYLRSEGREEAWTELQGLVYGARMSDARPYPGVMDFFVACRQAGIPVFVISHKTRHPFLGQAHDLHRAAADWLTEQGFFDPKTLGLPEDRVFFELTRQAKLERIGLCECTHFVDDLPEFLAEPSFPPNVERILFDPNGLYRSDNRFTRAEHWTAITRELGIQGSREANELQKGVRQSGGALDRPRQFEEAKGESSEGEGLYLREFLRSLGIEGEPAWQPLAGGANNRVRLVTVGGNAFVLKMYFRDRSDTRDRFAAEQAFYTWASHCETRRTPEPVGWEPTQRWGLFRFIAGRKPSPEEIDDALLDQATAFLLELNRDRHQSVAQGLPAASEACFSIAQHLECIQRRIERLERLETPGAIDQEAKQFVIEQLRPAWEEMREAVGTRSANGFLPELKGTERCLSPSDFGFHNSLLPSDGQLLFFDFEYAGWDDPAKLICDFFCQPQVPVPARFWERWITGIEGGLGLEGDLAWRARLLLPSYRIKWCCILLNEFMRAGLARREYAGGPDEGDERKVRQLEKARQSLVMAFESSSCRS